MHACACMFEDCYVLLILQYRAIPVDALQLKLPHSVCTTRVGEAGLLSLSVQPQPTQPEASSSPTSAWVAVARVPPTPGSREAVDEHPSGRWERSSYSGPAGHWLHKPAWYRLGLVPSVRRGHILFCVYFQGKSPRWLQSCTESSLLPTPWGTVSVQQGAKLP